MPLPSCAGGALHRAAGQRAPPKREAILTGAGARCYASGPLEPAHPGTPRFFTCIFNELNVVLVSIARRYARALLDVARESGQVDGVLAEIERIETALEGTPELSQVLESPLFSRDQRRALLEKLAGPLALSETTLNLLRLLSDRDRTAHLPLILREYRRMADELAGRVRAVAITPLPLPKETTARLSEALSRVTGKTVVLEERTDPTLIGGLVAKVGDTTFDGSLRTQLRRLRQAALA